MVPTFDHRDLFGFYQIRLYHYSKLSVRRTGDISQANFDKPEFFINNMSTNVPHCGFPIRLSSIFLGHYWSPRHIKAPNRSFLLAAELKEKILWTQ